MDESRSGYLTRTVGGTSFNLWHAETGAAAQHCVLFLHSLGACSQMWDRQVAALRHDYLTIVIDSRGHGRSDWHPLGSARDWVEDMVALLDNLNAQAAHLVGLSMGGVQALAFAASFPDRVRSLVLADTFAQLPDDLATRKVDEISQATQTSGMTRFGADYAASRLVTEDGVRVGAPLLSDSIGGMERTAYLGSCQACFHARLGGVLPDVRSPTLVVWGDRDTAAPKMYSEELRDAIPGAQMEVIHGAGHLSNLDKPTTFNETLCSFLHRVEEHRLCDA